MRDSTAREYQESAKPPLPPPISTPTPPPRPPPEPPDTPPVPPAPGLAGTGMTFVSFGGGCLSEALVSSLVFWAVFFGSIVEGSGTASALVTSFGAGITARAGG